MRAINLLTAGLAALLLVSALPGANAAPVPVYNGDLEMPSAESPPPGFVMWGPEQWKNRHNYTLDTQNPHAGHACLRINHPAHTGGYLVTQPEHALQPQPGTQYTITFFARAAHPGVGRFQLGAYESLKTYVDAPSPGNWPLDLTTQWKRYTFTVRAGLDFFADQARYIMLSFHAAAVDADSQTMWVDDITIDAEPNPPGTVQLINPATLAPPAAPPAFTPGPAIDVTIEADHTLRPANPLLGGVSFHRLTGSPDNPYAKDGTYTLPAATAAAVRSIHLPMSRLYGVGDCGWPIETAIDRAARLCDATGVPQNQMVLELETEDASRSLPPATWARAAREAVAKHFGFHEWEIGNEVYAPSLWGSAHGAAYATPEDYAAHVAAVAQAVRAVQPGARIGLSVSDQSLRWGNYLLRIAAGNYDFVCPHFYAGVDLDKPLPSVVIDANAAILARAALLHALLAAYNPHRPVTILDTEWALYGSRRGDVIPEDDVRNRNIVSVLHRAVRLIAYEQTDLLQGASTWNIFGRPDDPGYGMLWPQQPAVRSIEFTFSALWNNRLGDSVLPAHGAMPATCRLLAMRSTNPSAVRLVLVNADATHAVPVTLRVALHQPTAVQDALLLTQPTLDTSAFDPASCAAAPWKVDLINGIVTAELPAHAVAFVTLTMQR